MSVPFRAQGSMGELDAHQHLNQRHYSEKTLRTSFIERSGLAELERVHYGERHQVYSILRRTPDWVLWAMRPWNGALSRRFMCVMTEPKEASAVMVKLGKIHPDGHFS